MNDAEIRRSSKVIPPEIEAILPRRGPSFRERQVGLVQALRLHPDRSDRTLATWCNVSRELVRTTRKKLVVEGLIARQTIRVGADGKVYTSFPTAKGEGS